MWMFFASKCVKFVLSSILEDYKLTDVNALRAFTSARGKDSVYFTQKAYLFYFTLLLLQNTHISLSILQDYSIKFSLFINFLLFSLMVILF